MITAEQGAKLIAPHVEKSWPEHKSDLFRILRLALNYAWNEGKWYGMSREYFITVRSGTPNNFFIGPKGFDVLMAINAAGTPRLTRGVEFQFHKNGYGSVTKEGSCAWFQDVMDMGESPVLTQLNIASMIGVRSLGPETTSPTITIRGKYADDTSVYTYVSERIAGEETCGCISSTNDDEIITSVDGLKIPLEEKFTYIKNICFNSIESISKDITTNPVEVIAIKPDGEGILIARLEPHETTSRYRRYIAPIDTVCDNAVHAMFKISPQSEINNNSQPLIISNEEALIALAMGVHKVYYTQEQNAGQAYLLRGINALEKQKREEEVNGNFPIQVTGLGVDDIPEIFNRIS